MKTGILWENQMERDHLGRPGCRWEKSGGGVPWIKGRAWEFREVAVCCKHGNGHLGFI